MSVLSRRGTVLGLLVLGGLVGLLASGQPWFSAVGDAAGSDPGGAIAFTGADATGGLTQALPAVVLAGTLLTLVLAVRGRRVVAVLLALAGLGMVVVGVLRTPPSAAAVRTRFRQVSLADSYVLDGTAWPWPYAIAGLAVLAAAVLLWLASPAWVRRTRRYERSAATRAPVPIEDANEDPAEAWRALDAGLDPTLDPALDPALDPTLDPTLDPSTDGHGSEPSADPDVRSGGTTDTMGASQETSPRRQIGDQ